MRENSATVLPDLVLDCPTCDATGWVRAVADSPCLVIACPTCDGRSWTAAVTA